MFEWVRDVLKGESSFSGEIIITHELHDPAITDMSKLPQLFAPIHPREFETQFRQCRPTPELTVTTKK